MPPVLLSVWSMSVRRCSEVWERYRRSPYCHSSCCSSRTEPIRRGAPLRPPATATDADAEREVPGRLREIDYRSRFDPAADGARVLLMWTVRGDESVRGLLTGAGWCGWGSWDGPGRGRVQICCKGVPGRDRPRIKARNINDSLPALRPDPGLCNRFGQPTLR